MKRLIVAGAVALMCAGGAAGAQEDTDVSPAGIVAARQAAFMMSGVTLGAIKAGLDSGAELRTLAFPAGGLAKWAAALPTLFPAGAGPEAFPEGTRAKAEIWTDRAGFEAKAADYAAATARLRDAVAANDPALAQTEWAAVRASCGACHDAYRS
jgi:cytochrome c556